jgi:catechol 2,3-dioxygenase-like lactoylglutathione lyase family enzyme
MELKPYRNTYLSRVEIYVSDYAKSIRFYDSILIPLGWKRLVCQKSHTTYSDGAMKIVFCPTEENYLQHGYHRKRVGMNHLAFYAQSKESVDQLYQNVLVPNGIECLYEKKPNGEEDYYAVFFEDPDRIKIEVVYSPGYCAPEHWTNLYKDNFDPYSGIQK